VADDTIPDFNNLPEDRNRQRAVPAGRIARFGTFGRLVSGVAGGMVAEGARRLASGEGISARDLILTPGNVQRMTDRLSHLRGAAMKMGQMISLDAGDFLPEELSRILATLRDQARELEAMRANLENLAAACDGNDSPACPILETLAR